MGLIGSALAVTAVYLITFIIYAIIQETRQYVWDWLHELIYPMLAVVVTGGVLLNLQLPPILIWLMGLPLYILFLFLLGVINQKDRQTFLILIGNLRKKVKASL